MLHIRGLEIIRLNNFHWLRAIGNFLKKMDFALDFFVKGNIILPDVRWGI